MTQPRALDGIRVVDFSWVRAGPWATRWLGAFGAEIIKIEWPENGRGRLPSSTTPQDVEANLNTSGNFHDTNVNKKSLSLNLRSPKGLEIVNRPVRDDCMAFIRTPDSIAIELPQAGDALPPAEPWRSRPNTRSW
jgi:crotonobetainyl-CoA:carnitine CoA-transferase CaiB-like acyl-CoA transferase